MQSKYFNIPLEHQRKISLCFVFDETQQTWVCNASSEAIDDIAQFFDSGYYKLDPEKQITITSSRVEDI